MFTRRKALSQTSKIYDPLGLLSPFTLQAKLVMRKLCDFFIELPLVESVTFDRSLKPVNAVGKPILIIFSDGSQYAYGACAYIRWNVVDGSFISKLICAKKRLAPLKTMTIPRIELMGAVIGCRLRTTIIKGLDFDFEKIYHIIDSQIVLEQIHKDCYKFGVFVANRIAKVQSSTNISDWWWTESNNNVADIITRPMKINKLDDYWKNGPDYLNKETSCWPIS